MTESRSAGNLGPQVAADWHPRRATAGLLELVLLGAGLLALAAAVFGPHVLHGGFYADDWSGLSRYRFAPAPHYLNAVREAADELGGRPLLAVLLPVPHALFGTHAAPSLAFAVVLNVIAGCCFYGFLRTVGLAALDGAIIAGLAFLFAWSDATRLWTTASLNTAAVSLFFLGAVVALRGLRIGGWKGAVVHGTAVLLYVMSILTYEVAAAAAALMGILYLRRAPPRRALPRWALDLVAIVSATVYSAIVTARVRHVGGVSERVSDLPRFGRDSLSILASAFLPRTFSGAATKGAVIAGMTVLVLWALRRRAEPEIRGWLWVGGGGIVLVAAAYAMAVGSTLYPSYEGIDNRINVFAGHGFAIVIYALIVTTALLLFRNSTNRRAASVVVAAVVGVGFVGRIVADARDWDRAARLQRHALRQLRDVLARPSHGSTIYTFGLAGEVAPGVPVFFKTWDLNGAVRLMYRDTSLRAFPIYADARLICAKRFVVPVATPAQYGTRERSSYGKAVFVDLASGRKELLVDRSQCRSAIRSFVPGPLLLERA